MGVVGKSALDLVPVRDLSCVWVSCVWVCLVSRSRGLFVERRLEGVGVSSDRDFEEANLYLASWYGFD